MENNDTIEDKITREIMTKTFSELIGIPSEVFQGEEYNRIFDSIKGIIKKYKDANKI